MSMQTETLRARYPGWQVWQSDRGYWWATRRCVKDLPTTVSLTVGDVDSPDELASLIEADEAELAKHRNRTAFDWAQAIQIGESA
jgi:hypothetical protein